MTNNIEYKKIPIICMNGLSVRISEYLLFDGFKWFIKDKINGLGVNITWKYNPEGCILKDAFKYPKELHNLHSDCLLVLEKVKIKRSMLSNYYRKIANNYNISVGGVKNLVPSLGNKVNYVLHYWNLQLYLHLEKLKRNQ